MNLEVTQHIHDSKRWQGEFEALRAILLESGLTEEFKWEEACYTFEGANIVLMHGFKQYCALLFFKGALMKDPRGILVQQTENVQSGRQLRFSTMQEILQSKSAIVEYVHEAILVEKSGLKVEYRKTDEYDIPDELRDAFTTYPGFRSAFEALTPGRQRGYILYFSQPKRSKTREERIQKWTDAIFDGIGLRDEYIQSKKEDTNGAEIQ